MSISDKKNFIIGVGGTGMRCLETFTHMCACFTDIPYHTFTGSAVAGEGK